MSKWSFRVGRLFGGYVRVWKQPHDWGYRLKFEFEVTRWHD